MKNKVLNGRKNKIANKSSPAPVAEIKNRRFLKKRIPLGYVVLLTITFCAIFYWRNNKLDAGIAKTTCL